MVYFVGENSPMTLPYIVGENSPMIGVSSFIQFIAQMLQYLRQRVRRADFSLNWFVGSVDQSTIMFTLSMSISVSMVTKPQCSITRIIRQTFFTGKRFPSTGKK